jgi:hypothetical protein
VGEKVFPFPLTIGIEGIRRGAKRMRPEKRFGCGPTCHSIDIEVCISINFLRFPCGGGNNKVEDRDNM